jgi:hypothetical protein
MQLLMAAIWTPRGKENRIQINMGGANNNDPLRSQDQMGSRTPWSYLGSITRSWLKLHYQIWIHILCSIATVEFPTDCSINKSKRTFSGSTWRIMSKDARWDFSSCRGRDPKRYMGNWVESLEKLLLVLPRLSVSAGASKTATFHLVTNLSLADRALTLERSYLSFSAKNHSFLHGSSRRDMQQART